LFFTKRLKAVVVILLLGIIVLLEAIS